PLSTPYPPTTSESSPHLSSDRSLDSSSVSTGPCRSPTTLVSSSTPVSRLIAPTHADLLLSRKRFRDSYSPEYNREEHIEIGTTDAEVVKDLGIGDGIGAHTEDGIEVEVDLRVGSVVDEGIPDHVTADEAVEVTFETLGDLVQRFHDHAEEILVHWIQVIETAQR
ncbi:hypothetical protein Tco_0220891, partial [Tanacetum coccineum]